MLITNRSKRKKNSSNRIVPILLFLFLLLLNKLEEKIQNSTKIIPFHYDYEIAYDPQHLVKTFPNCVWHD